MKAFNGKEFLESKGVSVALSNGSTFDILEIRPDQLDAISALPDDPDGKTIVTSVASLLGCTPEQLEGIGIVELKGVMDFLSENLLS